MLTKASNRPPPHMGPHAQCEASSAPVTGVLPHRPSRGLSPLLPKCLRCTPPAPVSAGADSDEARTFVWYASYGSNLCEDRFKVYLTGGRLSGQRYACLGARQQTPPRASAVIRVPHPLFFALDSARWGGGVAFLDTDRVDPQARTVMRIYKISLQQFHDVVAQENGLPIPLPRANRLTPQRLAAVREAGGADLVDARYGYLKYLGQRAGLPILTFTCSVADRHRAAGNQAPWEHNKPSPAYAQMIARGLQECGLDAAAAQSYIETAAGAAPAR